MRNKDSMLKVANGVAIVAIAFCVVVTLVLGYSSWQSRKYDPLATVKMEELLLALNRTPKDEKLRAEVHKLDLKIRQTYFQHQAFTLNGIYLLIGGILVFFIASESAKAMRKSSATPNPQAALSLSLSNQASRRSVTTIAVVLGGGLVTLSALARHDAAAEYAKAATKPKAVATENKTETPGTGQQSGGVGPVNPGGLPTGPSGVINPDGGGTLSPGGGTNPGTNLTKEGTGNGSNGNGAVTPTTSAAKLEPYFLEALKDEWPSFRGPSGVGLSPLSSAPTSWSATQNVLWKSPVPLPGWNSPIVVGGKIFLSGASKTEREVYCFDATNGSLIWKKEVSSSTPKAPPINNDTGYAASTMASDGQHVFAIFPNGDLVAFDLAGKQVWRKDFGMPMNVYGHATSLLVYGSGLLVQLDQGMSADENKSKLYALDCATGKVVWSVGRPVTGSWTSPIVVRVDGKDQIITASNPFVIAYDVSNGKEIWRAECMSGDVSPSPAFGGGNILVANMGAGLFGLKPNMKGDITKTGVSWKFEDDTPDIVSLLCANDLVYMMTTMGTMTCVDAKTGKKVWNHSFEAQFNASPVFAAGRIYITDMTGKTHILDSGNGFKELGTASVGEEVKATLAFVNNRIYIRGKQHLFCIGEK